MKINALIVDNDNPYRTTQAKSIGRLLDSAKVFQASTIDGALRILEKESVDIAFVDWNLAAEDSNDLRTGATVLERIRKSSPTCEPIVVSRYVEEHYREIFKALDGRWQRRPRVLEKSALSNEPLERLLREVFGRQIGERWEPEGVMAIVKALSEIPKIKVHLKGRAQRALSHEVSGLLWRVFGEATSAKLTGHEPKVRVGKSLGGHSAAVFEVSVDYGKDQSGVEIVGSRMIAKFSRAASIKAEVKRFRKLIQMGVPSNFRVEMASSAIADYLGVIVYSVAGGALSADVQRLDDLVRAEDGEACRDVVGTLIDPNNRKWHAITGFPSDLKDDIEKEYKRDLVENLRLLKATMSSRFPTNFDASGKFTVDGFSMQLPAQLGGRRWIHPVPTTLVHGDLHGGNILVDANRKVYMIDYANARIGPRFTDAAALATTLRLIDPHALRFGASDVARVAGLEHKLLRGESALSDIRGTTPTWLKNAAFLRARAAQNAEPTGATDETWAELLYTELAYAISISSLKEFWSNHQLLRLATWISVLGARTEELHKVDQKGVAKR